MRRAWPIDLDHHTKTRTRAKAAGKRAGRRSSGRLSAKLDEIWVELPNEWAKISSRCTRVIAHERRPYRNLLAVQGRVMVAMTGRWSEAVLLTISRSENPRSGLVQI